MMYVLESSLSLSLVEIIIFKKQNSITQPSVRVKHSISHRQLFVSRVLKIKLRQTSAELIIPRTFIKIPSSSLIIPINIPCIIKKKKIHPRTLLPNNRRTRRAIPRTLFLSSSFPARNTGEKLIPQQTARRGMYPIDARGPKNLIGKEKHTGRAKNSISPPRELQFPNRRQQQQQQQLALTGKTRRYTRQSDKWIHTFHAWREEAHCTRCAYIHRRACAGLLRNAMRIPASMKVLIPSAVRASRVWHLNFVGASCLVRNNRERREWRIARAHARACSDDCDESASFEASSGLGVVVARVRFLMGDDICDSALLISTR